MISEKYAVSENIKEQIEEFNLRKVNHHKDGYNFLSKILRNNEINIENIINKLSKLEIAIPSWALGMGGTRFGRFSLGGQPRNLNEKINSSQHFLLFNQH